MAERATRPMTTSASSLRETAQEMATMAAKQLRTLKKLNKSAKRPPDEKTFTPARVDRLIAVYERAVTALEKALKT